MSERSKRKSRATNSTTQAALDRLKRLRSGEERAINFDKEEENVFEYIDEDEYGDIVRKRTEDEWIVNDGGEDYYEDGREIFDDVDEDLEDGDKYAREYENYATNKDKKVPLKRKKDKPTSSTKKIENLKSYLLSNQKNVQKKTFDQMKIEDDDLLKGILDGLNNSSSSTATKSSVNKSSISLINKNKRKLSDLDESLIPIASVTQNNPFSVSTETNFVSKNKKVRAESFDDLDDDSLFDNTMLSDNLFVEEQKQSQTVTDVQMEKNCHLNEDELNFNVNVAITTKSNDQNCLTDNCKFEIYENLVEENGNRYLNFYLIDAYEDPRFPDTIYMFGKVYELKLQKFLTCCLICKDVERKIFVYPRTHFKSDPDQIVNMTDVDNEIKEIFAKYKIKNFRTKTTIKNYAFEKNIATRSEYLEVLFKQTKNEFNKAKTQNDLIKSLPNLNGDSFSYIFNYSQGLLERFLIDLKLKGPCWLKIKNPELPDFSSSRCKLEFELKKPFLQIQIDSNQEKEVPLSFMSLSLKTSLVQKNSKEENEIISISCLINSEYLISKNNDKTVPKVDDHFCIIAKPSSVSDLTLPFDFKEIINQKYKKTKVFVVNSEKELIGLFLNKIIQHDPDLLIGHSLQQFDLDVLYNRLNFKYPNLQHWSKLGRLKRSAELPLDKNKRNEINPTVGRLICDIEIAAKELIRSKSYDLTELAKQILKKDRREINQKDLTDFYKSTDDLIRFIDLSMFDTKLITDLFIDLNIIPLYAEITKITGNIFSRTLLGGRSERNEYLLLHAFHEKNYILPDKNRRSNIKSSKFNDEMNDNVIIEEIQASSSKRKKAAYTGGLVLDPKIGLHDKYVLLMDFNSLYPSIIQEYKICFTTSNRESFLECLREDSDPDKLLELKNSNLEEEDCILPTEIKKLVDERKKVKTLIIQPETTSDQKQQLDIKQKALKLTANSMYGCLGFSNSRFYAKPLAALITAKGREILSKTKQLAEESSLKLEVIYGDTDSLMINTKSLNYDEAESLGYKLQAEINKNYKQLEIGIDGIFRSILLVKKKKYAAVIAKKENGEIKFAKEVKGLDIVRRDWSVIARKTGEKVLDEILSFDKSSEKIIEDIHNYLAYIRKEIDEKRLPMNNFIILKQLNKDPTKYSESNRGSHVMVALRMNESKKRSRPFKSGDTIPFVICLSKENKENFNKKPSTQRAFHVDEYKDSNGDLEIDSKYYLQQQIHPIVSRLIDPIEGTDANLIAEFLGIESTISSSANKKGTDLDYELLTRSNETRFDTCKSLTFICPNKECKNKIEFRSLVEKESKNGKNELKLNFLSCSNCSENFSDEKYRNYFTNHLKIFLRSLLSEYYQTWFTCEDAICKFKTRRFTSLMTKKGPVCPECSENILYPVITDAQIYLQFNFFDHILDTKRVLQDELPKTDDENENLKEIKTRLTNLYPFYNSLLEVVREFKGQQAYDVVDLTFLFGKQVFTWLNQN